MKKETGYVQDKNGVFTQLNDTNGGHSLDIKIDRDNTTGYIYTHLNDFPTGKTDPKTGRPFINKIKRMFSPADVIKFLQIAKYTEYNNIPLSSVYGTMVSSSGTYTLKFTGNTADIKDLKTAEEYESDYIKLMKKGNEKGFLRFLRDHIKVEGIELYKIKNSGRIRPKTLDESGKVETGDC
ncbi:hypothetical protein EGM88_08565 [Aureibaculum marinum]|uniref:Uncharacterized protein n=1 Tax=Aureibaculum marinum TaxID=2487930 RepID=A0A3N4NMC7_9FLAO|nr:hypothetical protein [Aureibaculum marinum]RPD97532.1 hypothetical protein EGM88_08565 [Aureibaculum marinum]